MSERTVLCQRYCNGGIKILIEGAHENSWIAVLCLKMHYET